jgi:signal transduction histidine kinase/DNA-binding NarL/FixJ family response regulator
MLRCIGMIGEAVGADRVSTWKNYLKDNKLRCLQKHEWLSKPQISKCLLKDNSYDLLPHWEKTLSRGNCISARISDMPPKEQELLSPEGVLSIFAVPVFTQEDTFWGFVGIDNCHEERIYTETEQTILRSGSLLIADAFVRYEMTQNARETAARLQTVVETYPGIIWRVEIDGTLSLLNGKLIAKLGGLGVPMDNLVGKSFFEMPPSIMHPEIVEYTRKTFAEGAQEWVLKTELGAYHVYIFPVYGDDGKMTGVVGTSDEITEIVRLQDELTEALDKANEANMLKNFAINSLESIFNSLDAMIYTTVPETGEVLFVNNYMKKAFEKSDNELLGKYCYKVFRGIDQFCDFCPCFRLKEDPEAKIVWEENEPVSGKHIRHTDCLIDWPSGEKIHLQHAVDITELVHAKEAAERSNRSKGIFIAQMSHEIRTPMSAILGISEMQLRDERLPAEAEERKKKIYDSGNLLLNIINDILDFSKIDAGKMDIVPNKYDTPSLINDTVQLCRIRFESKLIDFNLHVDESLPLELIGDELRIRQILNNLLSNAFKYTDKGEVNLSISVESESVDRRSVDETAILVFKVSDTGQGMTKDQIDRIFDEYSRFDMEINYGKPGTGLGMNITKRLIDMMDGQIVVESEPGKGSLFTVRLPQKKCGPAVCGADIAESLRNFRFSNTTITKRTQIVHEYMPYGKVLIVDDVESNLFVAKGLLIPYGLQIETAKSGFEAIEKIKNGGVYDIVFMDHMMPGMDGIKATGILRGGGYTRPIVALTANAISGQSEMFLSNGFDKFISKPIDSRELDLALKEFIRNRKPPEIIEAAQRAAMWREREKAIPQPKKGLTELEKLFVKDAENAINALEDIYAKINDPDDADIVSYTTAAHGIKSALKNIGEEKLSEFAYELEKAGKARKLDIVGEKTPAFIKELESLIEKMEG